MKKFLFAAGAFALIAAAVATAQDPAKPAQNPAVQPKAAVPILPGAQPKAVVQPAIGRVVPVTAAKMAQLEEEYETLEAHHDVRKAHVRAAEVAVRSAGLGVERLRGLATKGVVSKEEIDKAELEVEAAKAQLEIRIAEMKEVEVKIKFAKKRLDEAKAAGVRPAPGAAIPPRNPAVDPPPPQ